MGCTGGVGFFVWLWDCPFTLFFLAFNAFMFEKIGNLTETPSIEKHRNYAVALRSM